MARFAIYQGAHGSRFVSNTKQGPLVARASKASGVPITSNARDDAARNLLHAIGQHSQAEVIRLHARGVPGYGPANPVNRSTHCGRNDGVAYRRRPPGYRLPWWAWGVDVPPAKVARFCATMRAHNVTCTPTYPGSVGEAQHVNIRRLPRWFATIKPGARGPRVLVISRWLRELGYYKGKPTARYAGPLVDAVRVFQRRHHLGADAIYGPHTSAALHLAINRHRKEKRK